MYNTCTVLKKKHKRKFIFFNALGQINFKGQLEAQLRLGCRLDFFSSFGCYDNSSYTKVKFKNVLHCTICSLCIRGTFSTFKKVGNLKKGKIHTHTYFLIVNATNCRVSVCFSKKHCTQIAEINTREDKKFNFDLHNQN